MAEINNGAQTISKIMFVCDMKASRIRTFIDQYQAISGNTRLRLRV